jgi:hypothetical protein
MDDAERALLEEQVLRAHNQQISVIAAAGNSGGPLETPASVAGVLPIAAGNTTDGSLCGYASWEIGTLIGPGCDISIAWQGLPARTDSGGSSSASAFASTLVALLRTLRPEASAEDAEGWLRRGASSAQGRPVLNGEIAARTAGLGAVVDHAQVRMAAATSSPRDSSVGDANPVDAINAVANPVLPNSSDVVPGAAGSERPSAQVPRRLPAPRARVRWSAGILTVVLQTHSRYSETLRVDIRSRDAATMIKRVSEGVARTGARFRLRARPDRVSVQLLPVTGDVIKASRRRTLRARRGGQFK